MYFTRVVFDGLPIHLHTVPRLLGYAALMVSNSVTPSYFVNELVYVMLYYTMLCCITLVYNTSCVFTRFCTI